MTNLEKLMQDPRVTRLALGTRSDFYLAVVLTDRACHYVNLQDGSRFWGFYSDNPDELTKSFESRKDRIKAVEVDLGAKVDSRR